jgi:hypothetical protein
MKVAIFVVHYAPCLNSISVKGLFQNLTLLLHAIHARCEQTELTSSTATLSHYHVLVAEAVCENSFLVDI